MNPTYQKARRLLSRRDAAMKTVIKTVGPCTLRFESDGFAVLARSIVSQQISTKVAITISARLLETLKNRLEPAAILRTPMEKLRAAGLSQSKATSLLDLATKCKEKAVDLAGLPEKSDDDVVAELTQVRGIGPWTAQMFLIFSLGRLDVLPVADYGLRAGVQKLYALADLPKTKEVELIGQPWAPYRSIATWYVWRSLGPTPQS